MTSFDVAVARLTLAATTVCYAWFWTWFVFAMLHAGPAAVWISLFAFLLAVDHLNHLHLLWIVPRSEFLRPVVRVARAPRAVRVAMIVTKAPSEPEAVVQATLRGFLAQDVPEGATVHAWVADERPSDDMLAWCAENGVRVSTRFGKMEYHRADWPKRTKCKEGNLRYFYDEHIGEYDVVCQFDCDHIPTPGYLAAVIPRFDDDRVAYVAAPNLSTRAPSWFGRARRELEAPYYGTYLSSLSAREDDAAFYMPSCTGSHYAVRASAIAAIGGGLGPELDEDLSTTMMLAKAGFAGAYAHDAIANGEGPDSLAAGLLQEFQWSRSAVLVFTRWASVCFPWRKARAGAVFRAANIALWYITLPLWFAWFVGGPITASYSGWCLGEDACAFNAIGLVLHAVPCWAVSIGWDVYQARRGWMRPSTAPGFSLIALPYRAFRVVYMTCGVVAGLVQLVTRRTPAFSVTNKGDSGAKPLPFAALVPLYAIPATFAITFWTSIAYDHRAYNGFYLWAGQIVVAALAFGCVVAHVAENGKRTAILPSTIAHAVTCAAFAASAAIVPIFPAAKAMVFGADVMNAVFVPHWISTIPDMWLTIGVLGFAVFSGACIALSSCFGSTPAPATAPVPASPAAAPVAAPVPAARELEIVQLE